MLFQYISRTECKPNITLTQTTTDSNET